MSKKRIIFLPLEAYKARYTEYTSVAGGVYETIFEQNGIEFESLRPHDYLIDKIAKGRVLDGYSRAIWSFKQVGLLLEMINKGHLDPEKDVIYFEDFWTGGFEMVPYMQHLVFGDKSLHVPTYAFCHAQTSDPFDFTRHWAYWMRPMELGWAKYLTKVFCAAKEMVGQWDLVKLPSAKLAPIGHIWDTATVRRLAGSGYGLFKKQPLIVFSSRFDTEKNPLFFIDVANKVLTTNADAKVIFCSGHSDLKTNSPEIEKEMLKFASGYSGRVSIHLGLSKREYFAILNSAKVQFNCADQDFISYTMLEAAMHNCAPLYPKYLTFPDALNNSEANLYCRSDVNDAVAKLSALLDSPAEDYSWICKKYETSGLRLLSAMGFDLPKLPPSINAMNELSVADLKLYLRSS